MGGFGSGFYQSGKNTTDDYRQINVQTLQRGGFLKPGRVLIYRWTCNGASASLQMKTEADRIIFGYKQRVSSNECSVRLDWTACNYGGRRAWFICPATECGKRVAILYLGDRFACRHCYQLVYTSQREQEQDRALRIVRKIRSRLGWELSFIDTKGDKPRGMHWRTFERLTDEHDTFVRIIEAYLRRIIAQQDNIADSNQTLD